MVAAKKIAGVAAEIVIVSGTAFETYVSLLVGFMFV